MRKSERTTASTRWWAAVIAAGLVAGCAPEPTPDASSSNRDEAPSFEALSPRVAEGGVVISSFGLHVPLPDHGAVGLIDQRGALVAMASLGGPPGAMALAASGALLVAVPERGEVAVLSAHDLSPIATHDVGGSPSAIALLQSHAFVTVRDTAEVAHIDVAGNELLRFISLPEELPVGVVVDGLKLVTVHEGPRASVVVTDLGGSVQSKVVRLLGRAPNAEPLVSIWAPRRLEAGRVNVRTREAGSITFASARGDPAWGVSVTSGPTDSVTISTRTGEVIAHQRSNAATPEIASQKMEVQRFGDQSLIELRRDAKDIVDRHAGETGMALDDTTRSIYLFNSLIPSVRVLRFEPRATAGFDLVEIEGSGEPLLPIAIDEEIYQGRLLFHDSTDPRLSGGGVSCASCHPGGGSDGGLVFELGGDLFPTMPVWGGISDTLPLHWRNDMASTLAINEVTIEQRMGGRGITETEVDALFAYIDTLRPPAPPPRDATLVARGRTIFESQQTGCTTCHVGDKRTDGLRHAFNRERFDESIAALEVATPPLIGLAFTPPYMFDSSAHTLEELVNEWVRTDRMGTGSHLDDDDAAALVAFLETL